MARDSVANFLRLAQIPRENVLEVEEFLRTQENDPADTLAVLERPDQPVALLKIHHDEATLFSVLPSQRVHETYIGRVPDAVITQVHAIEDLADASALKPERVEIKAHASQESSTSRTTAPRSGRHSWRLFGRSSLDPDPLGGGEGFGRCRVLLVGGESLTASS